jgi:hypothetical protein
MQNKLSERKLANEALAFLNAWPLFVIPTLFISVYFLERMWIDFYICYRNYFSICKYSSGISYAGAVFITGFWSLIFLKYVFNKDSAFVRQYGLDALKFTWLCTGIMLGGAGLDFAAKSSGSIIYIAILIVLVLWYVQTKNGSEKIKKEFEGIPETENNKELLIKDIILGIITGLYFLYFISPFCWYITAVSLSEELSVVTLIPFVLIATLIFAWQENRKNNKVVAIVIVLLPAILAYLLINGL